MRDDFIPFPQEYDRRKLNALYREIPLKDATFRTLRKYFNAMANLYGIITLEKAWEIIHSQCPRMVTKEEFLAFAEIARHECEFFCILGEDEIYSDVKKVDPLHREIIDLFFFLDDDDLYIRTKDSQKGKPYYIPPKQELLAYADLSYFEWTPQKEKLADFCGKRLKMSENDIFLALLEIDSHIRYCDVPHSSWLPNLEEIGIPLSSEKQLGDFLKLYQEAFNNGRMQCNRGFTPNELDAMRPPLRHAPDAAMIHIVPSVGYGSIGEKPPRGFLKSPLGEAEQADFIRLIAQNEATESPKKIPRNAPCPCGSGKKYKRCCGKE